MSHKQRVGGLVVKTLYKLYKFFGYKFVYFSLYFVVFYYFLFARNVRESLYIYYKHLNVKFSNALYFKHLMHYAITTSDRFISKSDPELYTVTNPNKKLLLQEINSGSVLLGNHFGGWATAINFFNYSNTKFHVVMNEAMIKSTKEFEDIVEKKNNNSVSIIDLSKGNISSYVAIANALLKNESVGLMGDRAIDIKDNYQIEFFGEKANFNKNPFIIAHKIKKPIILIFVVYEKPLEYKEVFYKLEMDYSLSIEEAVTKSMEEYVKYLSSMLKEYPTQWFNFYNFWDKK